MHVLSIHDSKLTEVVSSEAQECNPELMQCQVHTWPHVYVKGVLHVIAQQQPHCTCEHWQQPLCQGKSTGIINSTQTFYILGKGVRFSPYWCLLFLAHWSMIQNINKKVHLSFQYEMEFVCCFFKKETVNLPSLVLRICGTVTLWH